MGSRLESREEQSPDLLYVPKVATLLDAGMHSLGVRDVISPAQAAAALEISEEGVLMFDRALICTFWNQALERMFGVAAKDVVGRPLVAWLDGGSVERLLGGEEVSLHDCPLVAPDPGSSADSHSTSGTYDARFAPIRDDNGEIAGGVGVLRDTSGRRRAEHRVLESESRFRIMADAAPVLLWMAGPDASCTFFNQTWLDFTGRTIEDEQGIGWAEGIHHEDFQRCVDTYMAAFAERRTFEMEYRLRRADGQYRWLLDRGTPRWEQDGRFAGYIGSCVDITDRKDLESRLLRAVSLRDEFLSVASHELRTPLAALRLQLDSVARSLDLRAEEHLRSGRLASSTGEARSQMARLTSLVERLLDISRFSEGRLLLDHEALDLVNIVQGALSALRAPAQLAGCELGLSAPPTLPGEWDRVTIEQLVTNLIGNAIKFGAKRPVDVAIEESDDGEWVVLSVTDRGIGISTQDQRRIFERFERAVSTRHFGGLGLGLWVAKQIVEAHHGSISVVSSPQQGATFTVTLPIRSARSLAPERVVSGDA